MRGAGEAPHVGFDIPPNVLRSLYTIIGSFIAVFILRGYYNDTSRGVPCIEAQGHVPPKALGGGGGLGMAALVGRLLIILRFYTNENRSK